MTVKYIKYFPLSIILVLLATLQNSDGAKKHQVIVKFSRVLCRVYNDTIVQSFNCSLAKNSITNGLQLNADLTLIQLIADLKLENKLYLDRSGTVTKFHEIEFDACEALTKHYEFYLIRMVIQEVHRISNIPLQCPLKANNLYHMRNFTITSKYFPQFLPNMKWTSYINFSVNGRHLFGLDVFGSLMRKSV